MKKLQLTAEQKRTRRRIIESSYKSKLAHLGSCLSVVDIIEAIYLVKKQDERFILSGGHAGIALYAILEKYGFVKPELISTLHIHPDRNIMLGIDFSTGSLGQGLPVAIGMALSNRNRRIFCVITDGECAEGSIWEALRIAEENKICNLITIVNANGWGAYDLVSSISLLKRIKGFGLNTIKVDGHDIKKITDAIEKAVKNGPSVIFAKTNVEQFSFLKGQDAHYYVMNENDYNGAMEILK